MSSPNYRVRRATLDDLRQLTALWASMGFQAEELARRITEFQVAESAEGVLLGAVGLQQVERQGRVHSEAFADFSLADDLRPLLWDRIQMLAMNQGLLRLWTRETAPFWSHSGMAPACPEELSKLPAAWRGPAAGWLTLKLREDLDAVMAADQQFAIFMATERQRTARTLEYAKVLRAIAKFVAFAAIALAICAMLYVLFRNRQLPGR